jgi:predicted RNA binding protein YcfA (HicA-like mRNA interferase family)
VVSGRRLIKVLEAEGWKVVRQRGSHVRLRKAEARAALVVPVHDELKKERSRGFCGRSGCIRTICGGRSGNDWPVGRPAGMMGA